MTAIAALAFGCGVLVLASDSAFVIRELETGKEHDVDNTEAKLQPLSARLPLAAGGFGVSRAPGVCTDAVLERCRRQVDRTGEAWTVEAAARLVAAELARAYVAPGILRAIDARFPLPADSPAGAWPAGTAGALVAGYTGGVPEVWAVACVADGVAMLERKAYGGPGRWGAATSPGCDAAAAAVRPLLRGLPVRSPDAVTLEHAAGAVRAMLAAQIAEPPRPNQPTVRGPVHILGLTPDAPPRELAA